MKLVAVVIYLCLLVRVTAKTNKTTTTTEAPKKPKKKVDCEKAKLHAVYFATRCCELTYPENDIYFDTCHKKYSKRTGKLPSQLKAPERIALNICAHECSLLSKKFISRKYKNELDMDVIEEFYEKKYKKDQTLAVYMADSFKICTKFDGVSEVDIPFPNVTFMSRKCDARAARVMMCVRTRAMQSCPLDSFKRKSVDCAASKAFFKQCVVDIDKIFEEKDY